MDSKIPPKNAVLFPVIELSETQRPGGYESIESCRTRSRHYRCPALCRVVIAWFHLPFFQESHGMTVWLGLRKRGTPRNRLSWSMWAPVPLRDLCHYTRAIPMKFAGACTGAACNQQHTIAGHLKVQGFGFSLPERSAKERIKMMSTEELYRTKEWNHMP